MLIQRQAAKPAPRPLGLPAGRAGPTLLLLCLLAAGGCGPGGPIRWNLHPEVGHPKPGIVLLLADGLPPRFVEQGCRDGSLPNIRRRFWEGGARVQYAVSCVPAITYGAITTLLTGAGPGRHQIVGNRWFDPHQVLFRDYATIKYYRAVNDDFDPPTIYERLRPAPSANIQTAHRRGVTCNVANWAVSGTMWFFGDYTAVDKLTASSLPRVARWANYSGQWPTLLTCYFPGADSVGHAFGPSSRQFERAVGHVDYQIGRVCDWLESQNLLQSTYLVLASDHGMVDVSPEGFIDLVSVVRDRWGRRATSRVLQEGTEQSRRRYFDQFDTVVTCQNGRGAYLYFRGATGWQERPPPQQVQTILLSPPAELRLWNIPGVQMVAYLSADNEAVLRAGDALARVRSRLGPDGPEYAYLPEQGDVLGYLRQPELAEFVAEGYHPSRDWLEATADQTFPDVVPQLIPLLTVHRAGQVVLFAQPGYSFVREHGGHGGLHRDELLMTLMIAGPGISPGKTIRTARAVDLVPTLLDLLGLESDEDPWLEGVSLLHSGLLTTPAESRAP